MGRGVRICAWVLITRTGCAEDLSYTFNASYFVVSQCNPHIAPFFFYNRGQSCFSSQGPLRGRFNCSARPRRALPSAAAIFPDRCSLNM